MEVDDSIALIVGDLQGILVQQLRPHLIHFIDIIIILIYIYTHQQPHTHTPTPTPTHTHTHTHTLMAIPPEDLDTLGENTR